MTWLATLQARELARLVGAVFLLSMPLGGYSLALTGGVDTSAEGLLALGVVASIIAMELIEGAGSIVYPWYVIANGIAFIGLTGWFLAVGVNTVWWEGRRP